MFLSILGILSTTSFLLIQWIRRGVFLPIQEMNIAMHHIANGNFDYVLQCKEKSTDEMGDLYKSYEDMRLKLKESTEEMKEKEKQNNSRITKVLTPPPKNKEDRPKQEFNQLSFIDFSDY